MSDIKLKPCPFCGSTARAWTDAYGCYSIECDNEECGCTYGDNMALNFKEVVKAWNKRVEDEDKEQMAYEKGLYEGWKRRAELEETE